MRMRLPIMLAASLALLPSAGVTLFNLQQHFVAERLYDLPSEFAAEASKLLWRDTEVRWIEWRCAFKHVKLIPKTKNVRFGVKVASADFDRLTTFNL